MNHETRVVHCKKEPFDILIDRSTKWGNPYTHIKNKQTKAQFVVETREESLKKYKEYLLSNEHLLGCLPELEGKVLGCWCSPKPCHGQILIEVLLLRRLEKLFE